MRTPVMSGNWKMYKTPAETTAFFEKFRPLVEKSSHCEIVICPPFTNLAAAVDAVKGSNVRIGSQNIGWAKEGAFTGEVSGPMIRAAGASMRDAMRAMLSPRTARSPRYHGLPVPSTMRPFLMRRSYAGTCPRSAAAASAIPVASTAVVETPRMPAL